MTQPQQEQQEGNDFFQTWMKRAQQGDAEAQFEVGYCYWRGYHGVERSFNKAEHWWLEAAEQHDSYMSFGSLTLGYCYYWVSEWNEMLSRQWSCLKKQQQLREWPRHG